MSRSNLRKSAFHISIINAAAISLGFAFHILLGRRFGISWELDCLFISLLIFSFFGIFNSFITSLLLPIFNEIKTGNEKEAFEFADVVFKWSLGIGIIVYLLIQEFAPYIIKLFASGFDERSTKLTIDILQILFFGFIFNGLISAVSLILNSLYFFFMPAFIGIISPLFNIMAIFILAPGYGVKAIAFSYMFSNTLQAFIVLSYLIIKTRYRPTLIIYHHKLPELFKQSSAAVLSGFIWSLWEIISRNIASNLGVGTIALLSYAEKIVSILTSIIISPISSVFYSKVSELISMSRWLEIKSLLTKTMQVNTAISIFVSVGVIVFLKSLLNLFFLNSRFNENDINTLFYLMAIEMVFLVALSLESPLVKIMYGIKDMKAILFTASLGAMLFFALSKILSNLFGVYGLVSSVSITRVVVLVSYLYFVNKYIETPYGVIVKPLMKKLSVGAIFLMAGIFIISGMAQDRYILFFFAPIWMIAYLTTSWYVLKEEWDFVRNRPI